MTDRSADKPTAYLLSTCPRCKKLKQELDELDIECERITVDLLEHKERDRIVEKLRKHKAVVSFPVLYAGGEYVFAASLDDARRMFGAKS